MVKCATNWALDIENLARIEDVFKSGTSNRKAIYEKPNLSTFYHLSPLRHNIIAWYPFNANGTVLELGAETGIITSYLSNKVNKVIAIEENEALNNISKLRNKNASNIDIQTYTEEEFICSFNTQVDYIVITNYFEGCTDKERLLTKLRKLLKEDGALIMACFNRLGLRFLSGTKDFYTNRRFSGIEGYPDSVDYTLSKKEIESLFDSTGWKQPTYYYPYPDHVFVERIYSDYKLPEIGELYPNILKYEDIEYTYFDETKAFSSIIKAGLFTELTNSYLLVVDNKKADYAYTKFSCERNDELQIQTNIIKVEDTLEVWKRAISPATYPHLDAIYSHYKNRDYEKEKEVNIFHCPVTKVDNDLMFEYIEGETLEKKLAYHESYQELIEGLDILLHVINSYPTCAFTYTKEFYKVFGSAMGFEGVEAKLNPNIDLIPENIIINNVITIIDYEWVFQFPVPKDFIIYRSLLHSPAINQLKDEIKQRVYEYCGIPTELLETYYEMELRFQEYVCKPEYKIQTLVDKMGAVTLPIFEDNTGKRVIQCRLQNEGGNHFVKEQKIADTNVLDTEFDIDKDIEKYIFSPAKSSCIIVIEDIQGKGLYSSSKVEILSTNAKLIQGNTYFFVAPPEIKIKNEGFSILYIRVRYHYWDHPCIEDLTNLHMDLQNATKIYDEMYAKLYSELESATSKLERIKNLRVIRYLHKLGVIKW